MHEGLFEIDSLEWKTNAHTCRLGGFFKLIFVMSAFRNFDWNTGLRVLGASHDDGEDFNLL